MITNKWPKVFPPLTPEQQFISNDFMKLWHETLADNPRYHAIEKFNHGYAVKHCPKDFLTTLEIGAGLGEHLSYENLNAEQQANYVALELRPTMAEQIALKYPVVKTVIGDCQTLIPFDDNHFDRIIAVHVLEHLPNLPLAVKEMYRLCNKEKGVLSVVIPCEGGLAYGLGRRISAQRIFENKYKKPYKWLIEREHVNQPHEIFEELAHYFEIEHTSYYPIPLPFIFCNLCIGITLRPKKLLAKSHHSGLPFTLPPTTENGLPPERVDGGFRVGSEWTPVLEYSMNESGWNDDLTHMHEESAGEQHFIDVSSREYTLSQLKKYLPQQNATILEIGCSSGYMLHEIQKNFPHATLIGADVVNEPLKKLAKKMPNIPFLRFDMVHCPLPDNCVDAIVMLNVLEHIENDSGAIEQAMRILKPGGVFVIEVPAGPHLYDNYDKILMHYRRYKLSGLCRILGAQQFQIKKRSHLGVFLYPGFWLVKMLNKRKSTTSEETKRAQVDKAIRKTSSNKLMNLLMKMELALGHIISYPTGIRCLVTCVKK